MCYAGCSNSQYARLNEKMQLIYLRCKVRLKQLEYKYMQENKRPYRRHMYNVYVYTFVIHQFMHTFFI